MLEETKKEIKSLLNLLDGNDDGDVFDNLGKRIDELCHKMSVLSKSDIEFAPESLHELFEDIKLIQKKILAKKEKVEKEIESIKKNKIFTCNSDNNF